MKNSIQHIESIDIDLNKVSFRDVINWRIAKENELKQKELDFSLLSKYRSLLLSLIKPDLTIDFADAITLLRDVIMESHKQGQSYHELAFELNSLFSSPTSKKIGIFELAFFLGKSSKTAFSFLDPVDITDELGIENLTYEVLELNALSEPENEKYLSALPAYSDYNLNELISDEAETQAEADPSPKVVADSKKQTVTAANEVETQATATTNAEQQEQEANAVPAMPIAPKSQEADEQVTHSKDTEQEADVDSTEISNEEKLLAYHKKIQEVFATFQVSNLELILPQTLDEFPVLKPLDSSADPAMLQGVIDSRINTFKVDPSSEITFKF